MMLEFEIRVLTHSEATREALSDLLIETVAHRGSVGFMHPLERTAAQRFWDDALASSVRGERVVLGAWAGGQLVGTVTLVLSVPPNQPHRAEIAKMMTRPSHRHCGVASALLHTAEALALEQQRSLLVLDTASEEGASGLYEARGYTLAGEIPDYALKPHGGLTGTRLYYKRLGARHSTSLDIAE